MTTNGAPPAPFSHVELLACRPALLRYARKLSRSNDKAEELVQEALTRAMEGSEHFIPGSCLIAWLTVILRNAYYGELRNNRKIIPDPDGALARQLLVSPADQSSTLELKEAERALRKENSYGMAIALEVFGFSPSQIAEYFGTTYQDVIWKLARGRERLRQKGLHL